MKVLKGFLIASGAIVLLSLIAVGAGYYLLTKPRETEPAPENRPPIEQSPPEITPSTREPTPDLDQQIEALQKAVEDVGLTGKSREETLVITEAEINSKIPELLSKVNPGEAVPFDIQSVRLDLHPDDTIIIFTTIDTDDMSLNAEVKTRVDIEAGKPRITVVDIQFGGLSLPSFIENYLADTISDGIEQLQTDALEQITPAADVEWEMTEINVSEEQLTTTLVIKPGDTAN
jgi:hypothetical protein